MNRRAAYARAGCLLKLRCPPVFPRPPCPAWERVERAVRRIDSLAYADRPSICIGNEKRASLHLQGQCITRRTYTDTGYHFLPPDLTRFETRPSVEAAIIDRYADLLWPPDEQNLLTLASGLIGGEATYRQGSAFMTRSLGSVQVEFPKPDESRRFIQRLEKFELNGSCQLCAALGIYAQVVLSHPLVDGNGRLGRALALIFLMRAKVLHAPWIPLGPYFYQHASIVFGSLQALSLTGDYQSFNTRMLVPFGLAVAYEEDRHGTANYN